jgi:hypothetical protein
LFFQVSTSCGQAEVEFTSVLGAILAVFFVAPRTFVVKGHKSRMGSGIAPSYWKPINHINSSHLVNPVGGKRVAFVCSE